MSTQWVFLGMLLFFAPVFMGAAKQKIPRRSDSAEQPIQCTEHNTKPSVPGHIILQLNCGINDHFCVGFMDFIRDKCQKDRLVQYYCDSRSKNFYSFRFIDCEDKCKYKNGTGYCRPKSS